MYKLLISEAAQQDLANILAYLVEQLAAPQAAKDLLGETLKCYERLQSNPFIYETCNDIYLRAEKYHRALINNYVLIYKVNEKKHTVNIHRFFYGKQDFLKLI
ncbi:MAG: type II toxin-antitoxin system RelE/ParE family toxin [Candidatus Margulisbacteria bacterium]|jgi:plasmid stabilization system protein ParE|nr:type II toxin-antitoxin system RelE/ParE family toxin [Candidatus Margulisiibacteriota bacterium]